METPERFFLRVAVFVSLAFVLAACGSDGKPRASSVTDQSQPASTTTPIAGLPASHLPVPAEMKKTVFVVGDSIATIGLDDFVAKANACGIVAIPSVVPGSALRDANFWLTRLPDLEDRNHADAVVVSLGTNDHPPERYLGTVVDRLLAVFPATTPIYWWAVNETLPDGPATNRGIAAALRSHSNVHVVPWNEISTWDSVHPDSEGQKLWAKRTAAALGCH